ncbi:alpha-tubulin N-acetyltransferase 1-like isoform X2 [Hyposmocoma kahamanoa]|uniref:alpha-tubulin N-acetyltransferase 1-like isoform X2 n=1 Tax=Hyposmocoma kahamanoa TaxID=1477025 RepID=UPI000E6DA31C|nr:alpha-tubulin N-acetyltransferase 1-like isoform X2 [Hyposmocoma kahamanoa]
MEWSLPVNEMLRDDITMITHTLVVPRFLGVAHDFRMMQDSLSRVINTLGEESAAEQGLTKVITTTEKLRNSPTHLLYLLKDAHAKGGKGEVIGMLKVGRKRLFLFDERDKMREVEPLCVLDFYVKRDRQRRGMGRALFDHMLLDLGVRAEQLAVDGPSPKMEQFLRKNYGVERLVRQNNNFAIAPSFFDSVEDISSSGRSTPSCVERPVVPSLSRYAAYKPQSAIADVIHGGGGGGSHYYQTSSGYTQFGRANNSQ